MAGGLRLSDRLWSAVGLLLVLPALLVGTGPGLARQVLTWQPALAWAEPWRCWSAAWVHFSLMHLGANLAGALLLLLLGHVHSKLRIATKPLLKQERRKRSTR